MTSTGAIQLPGIAIRDVDIADFPAGATYGPCVLSDFEFVWLMSGEAIWERGGHEKLSFHPGQLLLLRPGLHSRFVWDRYQPTRHAYVHFQATTLPQDFTAPAEWPLTRPLDQPLDALCRYLLWLAGHDLTDARSRMDEVVAMLLGLFVRGPLPAMAAENDELPLHVRRVARYIQQAWSTSDPPMRRLSVAELAAAAGVSSGHLSRQFRAHFGAGPVATVDRIRLGRAASLLARSNLSVTEAAERVGFANPYHFSRRFREVYGHPPREHRASTSAVYPLDGQKLRAFARYVWSDDYPDTSVV